MNKILRRIPLRQALQILVGIPTLLAVVLLVLTVNQYNQTVEKARAAQQAVVLLGYFDNVAHNFAVERGLTAGFIGSGGANNEAAMRDQRRVADQQVQALEQLNFSNYPDLPTDLLETLRNQLFALTDQRQQRRQLIDNLDPASNAFGYYSRINSTALTSVELIADYIDIPSIAAATKTKIHLLWLKERAGQVRGKLNGVIGVGYLTSANFNEVSGYMTDEAARIELVRVSGSDSLVGQLRQLQSQSHWQAVANTASSLNQFIEQDYSDPTSGWFAVATKRIQDIKAMSDSLAEQVQNESILVLANAQSARLQLLVVSILLVGLALLLSMVIGRGLSKGVKQIAEAMRGMALKKDFSVRIDDQASPELQSIADSINHHLDTLVDFLMELRAFSLVTVGALKDSNAFGREIHQAAIGQRDITNRLASAIAEMDQSAGSISDLMQETKEEIMRELEQGHESEKRMVEVANLMRQLSEDVGATNQRMTKLADEVATIDSILNSINAIAEQTNLLALNAAIEAARAGEQGRGFAVVADEVRSLAGKTAESTQEISQIISKLQARSHEAVQASENSQVLTERAAGQVADNKNLIVELFEGMKTSTNRLDEAASAASQQKAAVAEINSEVHQLANDADDTSQTASGVINRLEALEHQVDRLPGKVAAFNLGSGAAAKVDEVMAAIEAAARKESAAD
ncbi:methyl-accepting chemotaxis protein [Salinibius halmophilus]|uniref:methyl-accepting chemotaxis protein n=1 Tax=Salinibius halmophilus TaxID=1853216 RepID=UPI000E6627E6|nr:methyl-accepting chemotaxis protein [Salinibius halmophilus]